MEQSEIKSECEHIYAQTKSMEERLKELRTICKHPVTHEGMYSYRPGSISPAEICSDCGELVKYNPHSI
jgi:hypothetical protein